MVLITELSSETFDITISHLPNKDEHSYELNKQKINQFPSYLINLCQHIKQLYLEGNQLVELPDEFYCKMSNLEYLDLRNNHLKGLSKKICLLKNLEILLLESNKIQQLPLELCLLENLKGLQLANNPLIYPEKKIIHQGLNGILQFLKQESSSEMMKKNLSINNTNTNIVKNYKFQWKKDNKINPFERKKRKTKIPTLKDIKDETMRNLMLKKLRFIMDKQDKILQKNRDIETIKLWRWKYSQITPVKVEGKIGGSSIFERNDDKFNKIKKSMAVNFRENCPKNRETFNKTMSEVTKTLANLELKEARIKDRHSLANYIKKVEELQERLKVLKIVNTHHL